jgi:glc operon protein GlcG
LDQIMADTVATRVLAYEGAQKMLAAALAKATEMGVPQCISIVDSGGHLLAYARMDGAFAMSMQTSLMKAKTAACYGEPTGNILAGVDIKLAIATQGERINLPGGLPVIADGRVVGAIGIGSGTGEQDRQVAAAGLRALSGVKQFD